MKRKHGLAGMLAGVGLALATLSGCQTWTSGMTLPSGRYLQHPPQFFAPSPAFPLARELASQERAHAAALDAGVGNGGLGGTVQPLPPPVPPAPLPPGGEPVVPLPPPPPPPPGM
jgi:hypothetical protein